MVLATDKVEERDIHGTLTYNGDVSKSFDLMKPYGPSTNNEMFWFVSAYYDAETNKTFASFTQFPPAEFLKQMGYEV